MCLRALGPSVKGLMGDQYGKGSHLNGVQRADVTRAKAYWQNFGKAYVAKLHYLYETTESRATKYNLKRRIEEVLEDESGTYPQAKELAIWRNIQLKNSGLL